MPPLRSDLVVTPEAKKLMLEFSQFAKGDFANASAEEAGQFFGGRADAGKMLERLKQLPQRSKVYFFIAIAWPVVCKFTSAAELHNWLIQNEIVLPQTDASDTR